MVCDEQAISSDEAAFEASPLPVIDGRGAIPGSVRPVGLALQFADRRFSIHLADREDRAVLTLGLYDHEDVIAVWRSMASASGLPLLLPAPDGRLQQPYPQIGRLVVGERIERRRLGVLSGRRPRFLAKRKAARLPRRPLIYREREIAGGRSL